MKVSEGILELVEVNNFFFRSVGGKSFIFSFNFKCRKLSCFEIDFSRYVAHDDGFRLTHTLSHILRMMAKGRKAHVKFPSHNT